MCAVVSSFQNISTSVKAVHWCCFLSAVTSSKSSHSSCPCVCSLGALLPSQIDLSYTQIFIFSSGVLSVISNVPTTAIFLMTAYPFHIPFLSLCLKISVIPPSYKDLSSAACRLLMCFIKCSCFPNTWWYYCRLMRWTALWDQMWCFHLVLILSEFVQCLRPKLDLAWPVLHGCVGIECSPLVQESVLTLWPLLLPSVRIKVIWLYVYLECSSKCRIFLAYITSSRAALFS